MTLGSFPSSSMGDPVRQGSHLVTECMQGGSSSASEPGTLPRQGVLGKQLLVGRTVWRCLLRRSGSFSVLSVHICSFGKLQAHSFHQKRQDLDLECHSRPRALFHKRWPRKEGVGALVASCLVSTNDRLKAAWNCHGLLQPDDAPLVGAASLRVSQQNVQRWEDPENLPALSKRAWRSFQESHRA